MLFAILASDAPDSLARRRSVREAHLHRVSELRTAGRLVIAGPFPAIETTEPGPAGFNGSLIIAEFESLEAAEAWAQADPYLASGAWREISVRPFVQVMP
jgi:hypothetical protein